jgi:ribonuclease VapC
VRLLSTACFVEASLILESRYWPDGVRDLDALVNVAQIQLVAVDSEQAYVARKAYRQFGKGRHPAALNFGDCFAYALALSTGEPLLFKGGDSLSAKCRADGDSFRLGSTLEAGQLCAPASDSGAVHATLLHY